MSPAIPLPLEVPELDVDVAGGARFRRSILPGGVRLLTERVPGASSVAIGYWVPVGSRDEAPHQYGSTHFLEHLLFKGTPTRTAFDLAVSFDRVGGEHNAATSHEHTVYHAKVGADDLEMAIASLSDMITSSVIDREEFETERGVILEELAMADDDPTDVLWERFYRTAFGAHPLSRPIGGTPDTIRATSRDDVWEHYRARYRPQELIVTIAGAVEHDEARALVTRTLAAGDWRLDDAAAPAPRRDPTPADVIPEDGLALVERPLEQVGLILGSRGLRRTDDRRHALGLLHRIFGGGMSSRLFQEVRERRGLAYSVHSFAGSHADAGVTGMYAGCAPAKAAEVARVMRAEVERLVADGVTDAELDDAKGATAGASALALENTETRMNRLGRSEVYAGEFVDLDSALERTSAVTADEVLTLAGELFGGPLLATAIGTLPDDARAELER
ncbi:peptidase M16 [Pseudoclavibacter endophyticus]|uniref:Insulinase family protein n=1 Tax=Pseudoclavibacter endophyticus TaxID=1778590 RepID=A0A6H9WUR1_9MICO|nr:pitrilysin family protein [Pseudoclavibacter endophyticus]KAB1649930.1 insulinase family protein [Pseudoclavibacter endophyticus]GGA58642.1 peptidase M16 [Pseudoclavibacter endophyticus]